MQSVCFIFNNFSLQQSMKRVITNAYKHYIKSRPAPSKESVKRSKELNDVIMTYHPMFGEWPYTYQSPMWNMLINHVPFWKESIILPAFVLKHGSRLSQKVYIQVDMDIKALYFFFLSESLQYLHICLPFAWWARSVSNFDILIFSRSE